MENYFDPETIVLGFVRTILSSITAGSVGFFTQKHRERPIIRVSESMIYMK